MILYKNNLTVLLLFFFNFGHSQIKHSYPNFIGENLNSIENHLDWKIIERASGVLSKDGIKDYALILESKDNVLEKSCDDCKAYKYKPRIILILISQNGEIKVVIQNNKFIEPGNESGDEWSPPDFTPSLYIENGLLRIYYQYTRSNDSFTFELDNNQLKIIYAENNVMSSGTGDYNFFKYDFNKKEVISINGNLRQETEEKTIEKFEINQKMLSELGAMSKWEILEN